jgi:hypothetical protein
MRICVSGTNGQGKSTFTNDFLKEWPMYSIPESSYRDVIKRTYGKKTNEDVQWKILNNMLDELQQHTADEYILYDRSTLDNIVYTLWSHAKDPKIVSEKFVNKCITLVRESFKMVDIILFTPITRHGIVDHNTKEYEKNVKKGLMDDEYRTEIDHLFKAVKRDWDINSESRFFDPHDKPGFIDIVGSPMERIQLVKMYLDVDGDLIGGDGLDVEGLLTPEEIEAQETIKEHFGITDSTTEALRNPKGYE